MSVTLRLSDQEAQELADLADVAIHGDGHRPHPCPICILAGRLLEALARADVAPTRRKLPDPSVTHVYVEKGIGFGTTRLLGGAATHQVGP